MKIVSVESFGPETEVVDGRMHVPEGAGRGVEVSPEWPARSDHHITQLAS